MLDDFYDKFYIIKICFSIIIRNIFWAVEAVFEEIRAFIFIDNFKYFTAILAACFNSPSPSLFSHIFILNKSPNNFIFTR